jgi:hypothetical protein
MRKLLTLAIPMLLGVGLLTAAVHSDPQKSDRSQGGFASAPSQPAVIEEAAAPTTTTTAAPETTTTTAAPTTTTTLAPVTTTTAKRAITPVTSPRPPRATTTTAPAQTQAASPQAAVIDCGTGSANAKGTFGGTNVGAYVINDSTKAIELDSLVVTVTYQKAGQKQYRFDVSNYRVGARPETNEATFSMPSDVTGDTMVDLKISDFKFHTAGLPECASH